MNNVKLVFKKTFRESDLGLFKVRYHPDCCQDQIKAGTRVLNIRVAC